MSLSTVTTLERRIESLEAEIRRKDEENRRQTGAPSLEDERNERYQRVAAQAEKRTAEANKQRWEACRQEEIGWLAVCGVAPDATAELQALAFAVRGFDTAAYRLLAEVVTAITSEKQPVDVSEWKHIVACWPKLAPSIQSALTALAAHIAYLKQALPIN